MQHIILCLQDTDPYAEAKNNATYVQCSRRRFSLEAAKERAAGIAPSRKPVIVPVPTVPIDDDGYPTDKEKVMVYTVFGSGLEVEMTKEQANSMSHQGDCLADVQAEIANGLGKQLEGQENAVRSELSEYGSWDDDELADDEKNLERILWLAAGNITEGDYEEMT